MARRSADIPQVYTVAGDVVKGPVSGEAIVSTVQGPHVIIAFQPDRTWITGLDGPKSDILGICPVPGQREQRVLIRTAGHNNRGLA